MNIFFALILLLCSFACFSDTGRKVEEIFYCGSDFALKMDNKEWYLVQKSSVGEQKFDHLYSMALALLATGKKTGNFFPGEPVPNWCGNSNFKPITSLSITNK